MPDLNDASRPRLATGCRWSGDGENRTLLFPEGTLRVQQTARAILELCDGERTIELKLYARKSDGTVTLDGAATLRFPH